MKRAPTLFFIDIKIRLSIDPLLPAVYPCVSCCGRNKDGRAGLINLCIYVLRISWSEGFEFLCEHWIFLCGCP